MALHIWTSNLVVIYMTKWSCVDSSTLSALYEHFLPRYINKSIPETLTPSGYSPETSSAPEGAETSLLAGS